MLSYLRPDTDRHWSLANFVFGTFTLFLAGFYFVPNAVDLYKFYIAAVFLPGLLLIPAVLTLSWRSMIWRCLLVHLCYMLLSSLWSADFSGTILWRDIRYIAYILCFILLILYFFQRNSRLPAAVMQRTCLVVIAAAVASIALFEPAAQLPKLTAERLAGIGSMVNVNSSAFVYGLFGVVALDNVLQHWGKKAAYFFSAGFAVIVLFLVLTQSNTSLLALFLACGILLLIRKNYSLLTVSIGLLFIASAAFYLAWSLGLLATAIDAGFTMRAPIWKHVLEQWLKAPIFGNGLQQVQLLTADGAVSITNNAHSLFLATLRDGGLVGLLLLLPIYVLALRQGVRNALAGSGALYLSMFVFGLICVLADVHQLVNRPRELWIILWLPLAFLIADELGVAGQNDPDSGSNGLPAN